MRKEEDGSLVLTDDEEVRNLQDLFCVRILVRKFIDDVREPGPLEEVRKIALCSCINPVGDRHENGTHLGVKIGV
ncbi:hypothetical protein K2Y11_00575 [bacterium]|nr:hypothetical protein [bacterium]